jgi:hypothetical protein
MRTVPLSLIAAVLLAAGCASSPAPRYFSLAPLAETAPVSSTRAVVVGPFLMADYLDRPQIVTREGANGIRIADFERWAEPLEANFQSVVAANLARLLGSDRVLEAPAQSILKPDWRVTGRVSRLDVDDTGLAVLEIQWGTIGGDGAARDGRRSRYEARAAGSGYPARVAAMNELVTRFTADVAAAVK